MFLVQQLRDQGYQQGVDFDFAYHPEMYDGFTHGRQRYTNFMFYDEHLAMIFRLTISNDN
jgi:hypothetical protein